MSDGMQEREGLSLESKVEYNGPDGDSASLDSRVEYPKDAAEKPYMGGDRTTATSGGGRMDFSTHYAGISPEQELAVQGVVSGPSGGADADRPGPDDVTPGRELGEDPGDEPAPEEGDGEGSGPPGGAIPTASISSILEELPEKVAGQIREQLSDVTGFVVKVSRDPDGNVTIDGDIKRNDTGGASPAGGGSGAVPTSAGRGEEVETGTGEMVTTRSEYSVSAAGEATEPAVVRFGIGAGPAWPTADDADSVASTVSSASSASARDNALLQNKIANIEGNSVSINVCLMNLTLTL